MSGKILVVDDDQSMCETLALGLTRRGFHVTWHTTAEQGLTSLGTEDFDVVVTDLHMDGMDGHAFCERIVANRPDVPVIVITAFGTLDAAIAAIRGGAYDFINKPFEPELLHMTIVRAMQHRSLRDEVKRLRVAVGATEGSSPIVGESRAVRDLIELVGRVAETDSTVLITGESGTGKELVASAIHRASRRRNGPFVAINCAAMPEALLESELFGHARGAFTDAKGARAGLFLRAKGGTLLLDEIGELPIAMQPKLLRALQERTIRPVGSDVEEPFDARIIAATNRDLEVEIKERRFREDLFYRINVIPIEVPPLRARGNDVLVLAQRFLELIAARGQKAVRGLSGPVAERLLAYSWPGNVRELQNAIERAAAMTRFDELGVDDLPEHIREYRSAATSIPGVDGGGLEILTLDEVERRYIGRVLRQLGDNKKLAAELLGLDRRTLYRKLDRYAGVVPVTPVTPVTDDDSSGK